MTTPNKEDLLDRVRKLLVKAEDEGVTAQEAEALTAKASELMARYGIDRARLGALHPETDKPSDRVFDLDNPWASVKAHLLGGVASAMRCQCVLISRPGPGTRLHVFGYQSDLDRADMVFTSLLVQMQRALAQATAPGTPGWVALAIARSQKAWRRSYMLGFASAAVARIIAAEERVLKSEETAAGPGEKSTALVLADRSLVVRARIAQAYPRTRKTKVTYSGNGYQAGHRDGQRADIGGSKVGAGQGRALSR